MPADWTQNPYLGHVEGMNEPQFIEHVRRMGVRISRAAAAGNLDEVDRLALALIQDGAARAASRGVPFEPRSYNLGELGAWVNKPGIPE